MIPLPEDPKFSNPKFQAIIGDVITLRSSLKRMRTKSDFETHRQLFRTKSEPQLDLQILEIALERNQSAVHLDFLSPKGQTLERWIFNFQPNEGEKLRCLSDADISLTHSFQLRAQIKAEIEKLPLTTEIRGKAKLAAMLKYSLSFHDGREISHNFPLNGLSIHSGPNAFSEHAKLVCKRFESALGDDGQIFCSVLYDTQYQEECTEANFCEYPIKSDIIPPRPSSPFPSPKLQQRVSNALKSQVSRIDTKLKPVNRQKVKSPLAVEVSEQLMLENDNQIQQISPHTKRQKSLDEFKGSFVGCYEESLLSGRLSTKPSKALTFTADLGVVATGKCRPSLRCPPHLTVKFNSVFYYLSGENIPTPYVGTIEFGAGCPLNRPNPQLEDYSYRLPLKGQLQLVIKNPKSTALKVFFVPYDFKDMPANTKTFIRQTTFVVQKCCPKLQTENSHHSLRHAVHLNFRMTHKKHLLLCNSLRVAFSARPHERDEEIKVVTQGACDPKYSPCGERMGPDGPIEGDWTNHQMFGKQFGVDLR